MLNKRDCSAVIKSVRLTAKIVYFNSGKSDRVT